jgi:hypothetical protein
MDEAVTLFDPDTLADHLTPGGFRYLTHAIRPGTPIASAAVLTFSGKVRLKPAGPWMPFRATETIKAGCSFRVTAQARRGPMRATIADTYDSTGARARVHAFGVIPVRSQSGPDLTRSARGRLVVESTWLPSAFLPVNGVRWQAGRPGEKVTVPVHGDTVEAILRLGPDGELAALQLQRWSNFTDDGHFGWVPFSATATAQRTFGGYTIPSEITATWAPGTGREFDFFHAHVEDVEFWA